MKTRTVMFAAVTLGLMSAGASPVAKVGETEYETLDEAVAAGGEIRLVADATVEWLIVEEGESVTLDLAGHTLTGTRTDRATFYVNGGSLTIDDSVGGGRITHDGAVAYSGHVASSVSYSASPTFATGLAPTGISPSATAASITVFIFIIRPPFGAHSRS